MKKIRIAFAVGLLSCFCLAHAQGVITIDKCYEWAKQNYPQIQQYGLLDNIENYSLNNINKAWYPQLSVNARGTHQSDVTKLPLDLDWLTKIFPRFKIPTVDKNQYQVVAQIDQTIWDGGMSQSARAITRAEASINRNQLESELYTLNNRVNQLYFGCLLQEALLSQNTLLQNNLEVNKERIKTMMNNGVANQADLESMEIELLYARQKEIELTATRTAFRQVLGAFINRSISNEDVLLMPVSPETAFSTQINRPELRIFDARRELINMRIDQLSTGIMPKIGAFIQGGFGRPGLDLLSNKSGSFYVVGVRLSWSLGKLYTWKNDCRKLMEEGRIIEVQRNTFLFNTQLQLLQQNTEIQKMTQLMQANDEIIRLRTNTKKAAEIKLENGIISVADLIREINLEDLAKQTATTHRIQRLMSIYNYIYTTN